MSDRYLKVVLSAIALELFWLCVNGMPRLASAQAGAIPVVITGVSLEAAGQSVLPVDVQGTVFVEASAPLKIEADRPLPVEAVPYTPGLRPGRSDRIEPGEHVLRGHAPGAGVSGRMSFGTRLTTTATAMPRTVSSSR